MITRSRSLRILVLAQLLATLPAASSVSAADLPTKEKKVVLIAGPVGSHPRGVHEYEKDVCWLQYALDTSPNTHGIKTEVHFNGWPRNPATLEDADTIVLIGDGSDRGEQAHPFLVSNRLEVIERQMKRGCGLVALHYSTFVPKARAGDKFLDWIGGYFDYESGPPPQHWYSKIKVATVNVSPGAPNHPICRGLESYQLTEEFYYNIRFRENDPRLTPILLAPIPGESQPQAVAWAVERTDGGRGFGFTGGHNPQNWRLKSFRKMVLNAIVWTAHAEVPEGGVQSDISGTIRALIVTGWHHPGHAWRATTPVLKLR
ncbi:MAG: ThuA domain-containing protein [Candidatus Omnitrophica bacterium]|nr:ThuA domain-containing protein [Candidatus Omnitrophota bacterium]